MNKITLGFFSTKSKTTIKGLLVLFALLLMNTQVSWGQQLLQWNTVANLGTETTEPSIANDANVAASNLTLGSVTAATNGNRFGGSNWFNTGNTSAGNTLAEAVAGNDYIQFVVTPNSGYSFTPTSLVFRWDRSGSGPSNVTLRSSADNYTADLGSVTGMISSGAATTTDRTITISGLANINVATTFRIYGYGSTATGGTGGFDCATGSTTPNVVLNGITSVTWNGSSWSNITGPTASVDAIIAGDYSVAANITAKTLTVNNNAIVTIPSGNNVTVTGAVTVTAPATLTFSNNANLIQDAATTVNANSGAITVIRDSNALYRLDYTMWSSPVDSQNLLAFSPLTNATRFYTYNPSTNLYNTVVSPSTTPFAAANGYLIRMPNEDPSNLGGGSAYALGTATLTYDGAFTGLPNNGDVSVTGLTSSTYNAVGNPYPSTISADAFINGNSTDGTLYFWRKTNAGTGTAYATYNLVGTTVTAAASGNGSGVPDGTVAVGQGFIVKTGGAATTLDFTNAMRTTNNSAPFFKTRNTVERNRVWVNLTNTTGVFSQMLVAYMTDATQGVDAGIDGKYINDSAIALNSFLNNEEFVIQGRSLPFDGTDVVPLAFKTDLAGEYTIAIDHVDGLFSGSQAVFLKDNSTGIETDLKAGAYAFTAAAGVDNARFSLKYQKTLGINASVFNDNSVAVYKNKGTMHIKSSGSTIDNVKIYDISGRLIFEKSKVNANDTTIESAKLGNQVLIVEITSENQIKVSKKLVN